MFRCKKTSDGVSGFTLLELAMVLGGAFVVLGIAVPVVETILDGYRLTLAAQGVTMQMQYARMKAVSSNEPFRVNFPADLPGTYQVETSTGTRITGPFTLPSGVAWNGVTLPGHYVEFSPTGNVAATGNGSQGRVKLINRALSQVDVVVSAGGVIRQTPTYKTTPEF